MAEKQNLPKISVTGTIDKDHPLRIGNVRIDYVKGLTVVRIGDDIVATINPAGPDAARVQVKSSVDILPEFGDQRPVPLVRTGPGGVYTQDYTPGVEPAGQTDTSKEPASVSLAG